MNVDIYLFMLDLNWFYLDLVLWVLSSCMNEITSLKKCVRKCLMDVNIVLYYCLCLCEKGLATLISYFFYFSACQTSLWSYRDWLGWIWSGHQNIFQWSQWKTGKIFFLDLLCSLCYNNWLMFLLKMTSGLTGLTEYSPGSPCVNRWKTNMAWSTVCILFF